MKRIAAFLSLATLLFVPACLPAQQTEQPATANPPEHFYRLRLVVEELNDAGTITNTRSYEETIASGSVKGVIWDQQIKTGSRVPIATGSYSSNGSPANLANTQFQYIDLGVNLDVSNAQEHGDMLSFGLKAEISSIARQTEIAGTGEPVIRQNSWSTNVIVPVGKPTVVFSSDDLDSKGKTQIRVTATRID